MCQISRPTSKIIRLFLLGFGPNDTKQEINEVKFVT